MPCGLPLPQVRKGTAKNLSGFQGASPLAAGGIPQAATGPRSSHCTDLAAASLGKRRPFSLRLDGTLQALIGIDADLEVAVRVLLRIKLQQIGAEAVLEREAVAGGQPGQAAGIGMELCTKGCLLRHRGCV